MRFEPRYPTFPGYDSRTHAEGKKRIMVVASIVNIHFDKLDTVEVYAYPVETIAYVEGKMSKRKTVFKHLNDCLVISKYMVVRQETIQGLIHIATLDKRGANFSENLWEYYP